MSLCNCVFNSDMPIERFSIDKKNSLLVCTYNPYKNLIAHHLKEIGQLFLKT